MASQGPRYPTSISTESIGSESANDWTNPGNIGADDAAEAQITAATYDANDISFRLKGRGFGFSIPAGATIDGIVVEIERRAFAGGAEDFRVQLLDEAGVVVGENKAVVDPDWPSTATIRTYGSSTDIWTWSTVTAAKINDVDFGVVLSVRATAANTDIGVDFIRVTVYYTQAGQEVTLDAALAGAGAVAAPLAVDIGFGGTLSGAGAVAAAVAIDAALAAGLAGAGTVAADLRIDRELGAGLSGVGAFAGGLAVEAGLSGLLSGIGAAGGPLAVERPVAAALAGAGTVTAAAAVEEALVGVLAGQGSVVADLSVEGGTGYLARALPVLHIGS